jgi:glycosyltransferase involved in cell wall biosynthesis
MIEFSIVVPCFNEEKNIPLILSSFEKHIGSRDNVEIILVNNGSTDNSLSLMSDLIPKYNFARLVQVDVNKGYGNGILKGLEIAQGEYLGWTHADMQADPYDILKGIESIQKNNYPKNIFVKGTRKRRPFSDNFFTVGMSFFELFITRFWLWDINAQPNIFHKEFYLSWDNPPLDFSLDLFALYYAKKNGLDIVRFPVLFPPRKFGSSSWNTGIYSKFKFIKRTVKFSFELQKRI